tara:strand:+ start:178 stop:720 length:543 start_codon:yes stop_codon:yes gene_type:complete
LHGGIQPVHILSRSDSEPGDFGAEQAEGAIDDEGQLFKTQRNTSEGSTDNMGVKEVRCLMAADPTHKKRTIRDRVLLTRTDLCAGQASLTAPLDRSFSTERTRKVTRAARGKSKRARKGSFRPAIRSELLLNSRTQARFQAWFFTRKVMAKVLHYRVTSTEEGITLQRIPWHATSLLVPQ